MNVSARLRCVEFPDPENHWVPNVSKWACENTRFYAFDGFVTDDMEPTDGTTTFDVSLCGPFEAVLPDGTSHTFAPGRTMLEKLLANGVWLSKENALAMEQFGKLDIRKIGHYRQHMQHQMLHGVAAVTEWALGVRDRIVREECERRIWVAFGFRQTRPLGGDELEEELRLDGGSHPLTWRPFILDRNPYPDGYRIPCVFTKTHGCTIPPTVIASPGTDCSTLSVEFFAEQRPEPWRRERSLYQTFEGSIHTSSERAGRFVPCPKRTLLTQSLWGEFLNTRDGKVRLEPGAVVEFVVPKTLDIGELPMPTSRELKGPVGDWLARVCVPLHLRAVLDAERKADATPEGRRIRAVLLPSPQSVAHWYEVAAGLPERHFPSPLMDRYRILDRPAVDDPYWGRYGIAGEPRRFLHPADRQRPVDWRGSPPEWMRSYTYADGTMPAFCCEYGYSAFPRRRGNSVSWSIDRAFMAGEIGSPPVLPPPVLKGPAGQDYSLPSP